MWHRALRQKTLDIKKEVPHCLIFNPVPLFSFPGVPVLTWPHELNQQGLAPAVPAGCFWREGFHFTLKYKNTHLSFHINVELLDPLQGKLFFLHQDANRIPHELLGHLQHFSWHGGREQNHLRESLYWINRKISELNVAPQDGYGH